MLKFKMGKRGSIPVTLLVILVVALLIFALFLFSLDAVKIKESLGSSYQSVQEYNAKSVNNNFLGNSSPVIVRQTKKSYVLFGTDILSISVTPASFGG